MDYERIQKPQSGGGFSPGKLRTMLLGVEKKRKKQEELHATFNSRSRASEIGETDSTSPDHCKDVDVVSVLPQCSALTRASSLGSEVGRDPRLKDHTSADLRHRFDEVPSFDYDNRFDTANVSTSMFEFQKAERAPQRAPLAPFSKPAPSKWDDAQKWIASPTSNVPKTMQTGYRKGSNGYGRQPSMKVIVEVQDKKLVASEEPDTKRIDVNQTKIEDGIQKVVSWEADPYPAADSCVNLSQHNSSVPIQSATTFIPPPSTACSVSMRDMGTEMTPIASQEPSRTGTPVRATTPMRSPTSSRPSTPGRGAPTSSPIDQPKDHYDPNNSELSEKELQMRTRREIMMLGAQLGKANIAAWASKEEEDKDASTSLKTMTMGQPSKSFVGTQASAWEEAEKAKYMARFRREEMQIQAWKNHQKAKTEADMRKIAVEVEKMQGRAQDKLMNKLAAVSHKAEEKRAVAEAKRNQRAAKTEKKADYIRRTGRIPSSFFCSSYWCC